MDGAVVGEDFEVGRVVGKGGTGVVHEARQRSTGETRALKVLPPQSILGEPAASAIERAMSEVRAVDDEHVVKLLGAGVDKTSISPWFAMELLSGEDLGTHVAREGAFERAEASFVLRQLFEAVAAIHRAAVAHGDLKPADVFITTSASVKILDLAVARVIARWKKSTGRKGLARSFASPEVLEGDAPTPASDVWSLGQLAFFTLVGRPFKGAEEGGLKSPLGARFGAWLDKCLAKAPRDRFADAARAYESLAPILREDPSFPNGVAPAERAPKPGTLTGNSFANVFGKKKLDESFPPTERASEDKFPSVPPAEAPAQGAREGSAKPEAIAGQPARTLVAIARNPPAVIAESPSSEAAISSTLPTRHGPLTPAGDTREKLLLAAVPLPRGSKLAAPSAPSPSPKSAAAEPPPATRDPRVLGLLALIVVIAVAAIVLLAKRG